MPLLIEKIWKTLFVTTAKAEDTTQKNAVGHTKTATVEVAAMKHVIKSVGAAQVAVVEKRQGDEISPRVSKTRVIDPGHRVKKAKDVTTQKRTQSAATHRRVSSAIVRTLHVRAPRVKKNARMQNAVTHRAVVGQMTHKRKMIHAKVASSKNVRIQPTPGTTKKSRWTRQSKKQSKKSATSAEKPDTYQTFVRTRKQSGKKHYHGHRHDVYH